jgi:hypothetical protein
MRLSAVSLLVLPLSALADPPGPTGELFPLAVGHSWTYVVSTQDGGFQPRPQSERFVVRVVGREMVGSQTCYVLEARLADRVVGTEHVAPTADGLTRFRVDKEDVVPPVTFLKSVGSPNWTTRFSVGDRSALAQWTARTPKNEISVPMGKFTQTVSARADLDNGSRTTAWYAAGVGMVRQTVLEGKRTTLILELEKFEKGE